MGAEDFLYDVALDELSTFSGALFEGSGCHAVDVAQAMLEELPEKK